MGIFGPDLASSIRVELRLNISVVSFPNYVQSVPPDSLITVQLPRPASLIQLLSLLKHDSLHVRPVLFYSDGVLWIREGENADGQQSGVGGVVDADCRDGDASLGK